MAGGLVPGLVLDRRYGLVSKLGAGGFGAVWLARDARTSRNVAVKILRADVSHAEFPKVQQRFLDEAAILGQLDHPSIVRSLDRFVDGEYSCVVTDFVAGTTLRDVVLVRAEGGAELRLDEVDAVIRPMGDALAHAHARGVVHRDLKPQNVMLLEQLLHLDVKVLDFGIARLLRNDDADATTVGRVLGTLLYMAPEQFETPKIGPAADQFALASIIFELLTLRWAWAHDERNQPMRIADNLATSQVNGYATLLHRICYGPRPSVVAFRPDLPEEVDAVLHRAWRRKPGERFASVGELVQAFRASIRSLLDDRTKIGGNTSALTLLRDMPPPPQVLTQLLDPTATPRSLVEPAVLARGPESWPRWLGPAAGGLAAVVTATLGLWLFPPERGEGPGSPAPTVTPAAVRAIGAAPSSPSTPAIEPASAQAGTPAVQPRRPQAAVSAPAGRPASTPATRPDTAASEPATPVAPSPARRLAARADAALAEVLASTDPLADGSLDRLTQLTREARAQFPALDWKTVEAKRQLVTSGDVSGRAQDLVAELKKTLSEAP